MHMLHRRKEHASSHNSLVKKSHDLKFHELGLRFLALDLERHGRAVPQ
jgi:hypothetical protein